MFSIVVSATLENIDASGPDDGLVECAENRYVTNTETKQPRAKMDSEATKIVPKGIPTQPKGRQKGARID